LCIIGPLFVLWLSAGWELQKIGNQKHLLLSLSLSLLWIVISCFSLYFLLRLNKETDKLYNVARGGEGGMIMSSLWAVDEEDLSSNTDRRLVWKAIRSDSERVSTLYKRSTLLAEPRTVYVLLLLRVSCS
jgi:hypothetical protein